MSHVLPSSSSSSRLRSTLGHLVSCCDYSSFTCYGSIIVVGTYAGEVFLLNANDFSTLRVIGTIDVSSSSSRRRRRRRRMYRRRRRGRSFVIR